MTEIIHCIIDEKFFNGIIDVFDYIQGDYHHHYVFFPEGKQPSSFRYLRYPERIAVVDRNFALDYIHQNPCDILILHNLSAFPIEDLAKVKQRIKIVWLAWGYDLYAPFKGHRPFIPINQFLPLTQAAINSDLYDRCYRFLKRVRWHLLSYDKKVEEGVSRIDYFSGVIPWEYEMMQKNSFFHAKKVSFTYFDMRPYATEEHLSTSLEKGKNILVGNSAGNTNNHIDIMEQLSRIDIGDKKVIMPLSYAGSENYVNKVIAAGQKYFGNQFVPLNKFMPQEEYQKIIASCSYAVYGIERQQALGNIWLALWNGLTVFMSKNSPLYSHLHQQGYHLFTIQDDLQRIHDDYQLTYSEVIENRRTLLSHDSQAIHLQRAMDFFDFLKKDSK